MKENDSLTREKHAVAPTDSKHIVFVPSNVGHALMMSKVKHERK